MKIAISSTGKTMEDMMDVRFGRCSYFLIVETETGDMKWIENEGQTAEGGAGIKAAQQVVDAGVEGIITGNVGPNAFDIFKKAGVKIYQCESVSLKEVVDLYQSGELRELSEAGPAHHGMGRGFGHRGGR